MWIFFLHLGCLKGKLYSLGTDIEPGKGIPRRKTLTGLDWPNPSRVLCMDKQFQLSKCVFYLGRFKGKPCSVGFCIEHGKCSHRKLKNTLGVLDWLIVSKGFSKVLWINSSSCQIIQYNLKANAAFYIELGKGLPWRRTLKGARLTCFLKVSLGFFEMTVLKWDFFVIATVIF